MRTINKHFWHRTQGRRSLRTSSYHIVIFTHLLKQFSKIKLKFKYPPSFSTLSIAKCVCEKICRHWEFWNIRTGWLHWISVYRILRLDEICKMQKVEKSSRDFFSFSLRVFFVFLIFSHILKVLRDRLLTNIARHIQKEMDDNIFLFSIIWVQSSLMMGSV